MISAVKKLFMKNSLVRISVYKGRSFSYDNIRLDFSEYLGGSVELNLDENLGIASVCLNNPTKKNAMSGKMMVDLDDTITQLENWKSGKGLVIFGAENNFCSGGDKQFAQSIGTPEGGYKVATYMQHILLRLQQLPLISVAFIEGSAIGGGAEIAIACDFQLFSNSDSAIGFVHTKMGLIPGWISLSTAVKILGYKATLDLLATGRMLQAAEAEKIGLCDAVVGDMSGAIGWLAQRTGGDVSVVRAAKCVAIHCNLASSQGLENILEFEKKIFSPLWGGPANKLALSQKLKHKTVKDSV